MGVSTGLFLNNALKFIHFSRITTGVMHIEKGGSFLKNTLYCDPIVNIWMILSSARSGVKSVSRY